MPKLAAGRTTACCHPLVVAKSPWLLTRPLDTPGATSCSVRHLLIFSHMLCATQGRQVYSTELGRKRDLYRRDLQVYVNSSQHLR